MKDWTSIAVRSDTHDRLEKKKIVKRECFDDVIRREMKMDEDKTVPESGSP